MRRNKVSIGVRSIVLVSVIAGVVACGNGAAPEQGAESGSPAAEKAEDVVAKPDAPQEVSTPLIKPVYPDGAAVAEMQLDYVTFRLIDNSGMSVVPPPPHFAKSAKVHLASHDGGYQIVAGGAECKDSIVLRVDDKEIAVLDPSKAESFQLDVDSQTNPDGVELSVNMAPSAQANFACGINVVPQAAAVQQG